MNKLARTKFVVREGTKRPLGSFVNKTKCSRGKFKIWWKITSGRSRTRNDDKCCRMLRHSKVSLHYLSVHATNFDIRLIHFRNRFQVKATPFESLCLGTCRDWCSGHSALTEESQEDQLLICSTSVKAFVWRKVRSRRLRCRLRIFVVRCETRRQWNHAVWNWNQHRLSDWISQTYRPDEPAYWTPDYPGTVNTAENFSTRSAGCEKGGSWSSTHSCPDWLWNCFHARQ